MIVEITAEHSVTKGRIGWLLQNKQEAQPYHDPQTYNQWDCFIFLADQDELENGKKMFYGSTYGFNNDEYRIIE